MAGKDSKDSYNHVKQELHNLSVDDDKVASDDEQETTSLISHRPAPSAKLYNKSSHGHRPSVTNNNNNNASNCPGAKVSDLSQPTQAAGTDQITGDTATDSETSGADYLGELDEQINALCEANDTEGLKAIFSSSKANSRQIASEAIELGVLQEACYSYSLDVIKCLIEDCGLDVKQSTQYWGCTLLFYLPYKSSPVEKLRYLVDVIKQNPLEKNEDGDLPVTFCAKEDALDMVKIFVTEYGVGVNHANNRRNSLLQVAVEHNAFRVAEYLIEKGAQLYSVRGSRMSRLLKHFIVTGNFAVFSKTMCVLGREPTKIKHILNASDGLGTCLHVTAGLRLLLDKKQASNDVKDINNRAILRNSTKIVELLIKHGADINALNSELELPLHVAARANDYDVAQLLLNKEDPKKQLSAQNRYGGTPLHSAIVGNAADVQELLLSSSQCDPTALDYKKSNIFHIAAEKRSSLKTLLPHDAKNKLMKGILDTDVVKKLLYQQNRDGDTPIDIAADNSDLDTVKSFLAVSESEEGSNCAGSVIRRAATEGKFKTCEMVITAKDADYLSNKNNEGNTALHLAAARGHLDIVKLLTAYLPPDKNTNNASQLPIHEAAAAGHLEVTEFLVTCDPRIANRQDVANMTPLHYAAMNNHKEVVKHLLEMGADPCLRDAVGRNALDVAIDNGNYKVACAVLQRCAHWQWVLMNDVSSSANQRSKLTPTQLELLKLGDVDYDADNVRDTPLRRMIRKMPQLANIVFDMCITSNKELCRVKRGCVEFLDDTYAVWKASGEDNEKVQNQLYKSNGLVKADAPRYVVDSDVFKANHPLTLMVNYSRDNLLDHPLVKSLIDSKCRLAIGIYLMFTIAYLFMVTLATVFMVLSDSPLHSPNWPVDVCLHNNNNTYSDTINKPSKPNVLWMQCCICALVLVCVIVEVMQLITKKWKYFKDLSNSLDWFCYISLVLVTVNLSGCETRLLWQWQLGAFCLLACWINMAVLLRRLPYVGIYVVMLQKVTKSFINFFIILFSFIIAFSAAFFVLLQYKLSFKTLEGSLLKTAVMMMGDHDHADIFYGHLTDDSTQAYEQAVTMRASTVIVYIVFLPLMSIIVLNLLIGLAVGDIGELMKNAKLERLGLSIDLALDVEQNLPKIIQRKLITRYVNVKTKQVDSEDGMESMFADVKQKISRSSQKVTKSLTRQLGDDLEQFKNNMLAETTQLKNDISDIKALLQQLRHGDESDVIRRLQRHVTY